MSGIQSTFDTKKNKTEIVVEAYLDCHDLQIKNRLRKKIAYWYLLCTSIIFVIASQYVLPILYRVLFNLSILHNVIIFI